MASRKKRSAALQLVILDKPFELYDDHRHDELTVIYLDFA